MIIHTTDSYNVFKYDDDYVDELVYNDHSYKHFIVFNNVITVYNNDNTDIEAEFELTDENYMLALSLIH